MRRKVKDLVTSAEMKETRHPRNAAVECHIKDARSSRRVHDENLREGWLIHCYLEALKSFIAVEQQILGNTSKKNGMSLRLFGP